jgi:hypothetical protein
MAPYEAITADELPEMIRRYLRARSVGDVDRALDECCDDVVLVDVDEVHRGREELRVVLSRPITERRLTFSTTGAVRIGHDRYDVTQRIEGDVEGGRFDLRYRFGLRDGVIEMLVIELGSSVR